MIKRIATAVAVFGAASIISGCNLEQPSAGCIVQDSSFALWQAKYIPKTEADTAKACGQLKGEQLGVWKYSNPDASEAMKAENKGSFLAIRPRGLASLTRRSYTYETGTLDDEGNPEEKTVTTTLDKSEWGKATAQSATLPEMPDDEGYCKATGFAATGLSVTAIFNEANGTKEELPAVERTYQYGDVEVYSHPSAPGTQLRGTLTYTENGCTAEYEVWALWPSVGCVPGSTKPAESCGEGSGLNPDFDAVCDADLEACVPAKAPASFKGK